MSGKRIVGVLGGMGPLATVDLYRKIIEATPARRDQDHLHVIIDADPEVPDRTEALLRGGQDPTPWLLAGAKRLAAAGADFIVVPCNTAHAFLPRVQPHVAIPLLSMIDETAAMAASIAPDATIGILATEGTIAAGLYQAAFTAKGLRPLVPSAEGQRHVSAAIAAVKAGETGRATTEVLLIAARELIEQDAGALVAACTELPLVLHQSDLPISTSLIDPTDVLARAAVRTALGAVSSAQRSSPLFMQGAASYADRT